jgi:hypothetical protein
VESKGGPGQAKGQQKGWGQMHHISQLNPKGADENYKNALFNCGPAVVAMLARGHGKMKDMTDAQLVTELGKGVVTDKGSTPEGIAQMMERADVPLAGDALGAGYSEKDVQDQLKQGHKLIAQVRSTNEKSLKDTAHYVVVEGMTREGNYVISDPLAKGPYVVKPEQLKEAVLKAPPDGGMLIPVAAPGEQTKSAAPTAGTNPSATAPGGTAAPAPAVAAPRDGFADPDLRAMEARRVTDPRGLRVAEIMGPQAPVDPNSVAVAGRVSNPFGIPVAGLTERASRGVQIPCSPEQLGAGGEGAVGTGANPVDGGYDIPQMTFGPARGFVAQPAIEQPAIAQPAIAQPAIAQPAVAQLPGTPPAAKTDTAATGTAPLIVDDKVANKLEVAEDKAFKVKDEELAKVDNSFTDTGTKPTDQRLVQNEQKNDYKLDVKYSGGDDKKTQEVKKPVVDDKMSIGDFIRNLLGLKEKGSEKAYDVLGKLEKSEHEKDKKALEHFKKKDKKDHGAGSRRGVEDFGG